MEFWGIEVKPGAPLKITPDLNKLIHISQAALGEVKNNKGAESVPLRLKIDTENFVLGTLSAEVRPQLTFDLVFEREFELSHDWKNGSVYFCGYVADNPYDSNDVESGSEFSSDEEMAVDVVPNPTEIAKLAPTEVAPPLKPEVKKNEVASLKPEVKKDEESDDDSEDSSDDSEDDEFGSSDEMVDSDDSEDSDDESDSEEEDEETPAKPVSDNKKRQHTDSGLKTPVISKKAKSDTPQKSSDGKKSVGGHTATPHPGKQGGNQQTPKSGFQGGKNSNGKQQTPKSAGKPSHSKGKHGGK